MDLDNIPSDSFLNFFNLSKTDIICFSEPSSSFNIIISSDEYFFEINCEKIKDTKTFVSIKSIKVNGNPVIRYNQINFPFKYVIPITCNHLIYKNADTYNVLFIKNNEVTNEKFNLLPTANIKTNINFKINENNMLYPKITDSNTFITFGNLCEDYHVRPLNIIFTKLNNSTGYNICDKLYQLFIFNKNYFLTKEIKEFEIDSINLTNPVDANKGDITLTSNQLSLSNIKKLLPNTNEIEKSYMNLLEKIELCRVVNENKKNTRKYLKCLQEQVLDEILKLMAFYSNISINGLVEQTHANYLIKLKILNTANTLSQLINDEDSFCSQLKILKSLFKSRKYNFNYNFEILFETLYGNELLDEQQTRYYDIIKNYTGIESTPTNKTYTEQITNIINYNQTGGKIYPLHHLMMGKGKSAVMSPLLTSYFALIHKKNPYIIVPEHLVQDTKSSIMQYGYVFDIENNIKIMSDSEIKLEFLKGEFANDANNSNKIFIIDEFDSLLDPAKSNFNIVDEKKLPVTQIYELVYKIVKLMESKNINEIEPNELNSESTLSKDVIINIINEIKITYETIQAKTFVENIQWGIDFNKYYAVPYLNKDKPIPKSSFSSSVLTIFLTIYYYLIYKKREISDLIIKFIKESNLLFTWFKSERTLNDNEIKDMIHALSADNDFISKLFDTFFNEIFKTFLLPEEQFNTSFVDILNIDQIYKIGYSGTVNVDLPAFIRKTDKFENIYADSDEIVNVAYALLSGKIFVIDYNLEGFQNINLLSKNIIEFDKYDAFIDQLGIFKNIPNENIAQEFNVLFDKKREIIFMTENDKKVVLIGNEKYSYDSSKKYSKPFIYYSQGHVIGVDIRQDYLPQMKGLVTINNKSTYTNVAQAVFRLRKLNLGHAIDILFIDDVPDKENLTGAYIYNLLKQNDQAQKINKKDLLVYQTIKSEIRKKRNEAIFKDKYKEQIKYYYLNPIETDVIKCLNGIASSSELQNSELTELIKEIESSEKLQKLVYNLGSESCETIKSNEVEKIKSQVKVQSLATTYNTNKYISIPAIDIDYKQYSFKDITLDQFGKISIPIDDTLSFVPCINIKSNSLNFLHNDLQVLFVLLPKIKKLLLIPVYMASEFFEEYILLSAIDFSLINLNNFKNYNDNKNLIEEMEKTPFLKFILKGENCSYSYTKDPLAIILLMIIFASNIDRRLSEHEQVISTYNKFSYSTSDKFIDIIYDWVNDVYRKDIFVTNIERININEFGNRWYQINYLS